MPVLVPFLSQFGLTLQEIFVLQAVFSLLIITGEVPTGMFADRFGRKPSLIIGILLSMTGLFVFIQGGNFWVFLLGESIMGVGSSFASGAHQALLYESLDEIGESRTYTQESGRMHSISNVSEGLAALAATGIATISLVATLWAGFFAKFAALAILFFMVEPKREIHAGPQLAQLRRVLTYIRRKRTLVYFIAFVVIASVATRTGAWLYQPLFVEMNIGIELFGLLWAATLFVAAAASWFAHRVDTLIGRRSGLILVLLTGTFGFLLVGALPTLWGLGAIILIQVCRGFTGPFLEDEIHKLVPSDRRATVFSVKNMLHNLTFAAVIVGVGGIAEQSIFIAFMAVGVGLALLGTGTLLVLLRKTVIYK